MTFLCPLGSLPLHDTTTFVSDPATPVLGSLRPSKIFYDLLRRDCPPPQPRGVGDSEGSLCHVVASLVRTECFSHLPCGLGLWGFWSVYTCCVYPVRSHSDGNTCPLSWQDETQRSHGQSLWVPEDSRSSFDTVRVVPLS